MPATLTFREMSRAELRRFAARGNRMADAWVPAFRRHLNAELAREYEEVADRVSARKPWQSLVPLWEQRMSDLELRLGLAETLEAYRFAESLWVGEEKSEKSWWRHLGAKARDVPDDLDEAFEADEFLARKMRPRLQRRLDDTITVESATTRKRIGYYLERFRDSNMTIDQQSRELRRLAGVRTKARADLLARTSTIWNYAEATQLAFEDVGIDVAEWLATEDDLTCPFCMEMDNLRFRLGEPILPAGSELVVGDDVLSLPLLVDHPPLHPNCRCAIIPDLEDLVVAPVEA